MLEIIGYRPNTVLNQDTTEQIYSKANILFMIRFLRDEMCWSSQKILYFSLEEAPADPRDPDFQIKRVWKINGWTL